MALTRSGAVLSGAWNPTFWSDLMLATYFADNVVPNVTNHDYEGLISKMGDKVRILKSVAVDVFDVVLNTDWPEQATVLDNYVELTVDYSHAYNLAIDDGDLVQGSINLMEHLADQGARYLGRKVEQTVLQGAPASATSTVDAHTTPTDKTNALDYIFAGVQKMDELNVPDDGKRFCIITPRYAKLLNIGQLAPAYTTGDKVSPLRTAKGLDLPIAGIKAYVSTNLTSAATTATCIVGHLDAISFAAQFNMEEAFRNPKRAGWISRGQVIYGYKVVQPDALVNVNVTFATGA